MKNRVLDCYRILRVWFRRLVGTEPNVVVTKVMACEFFGNNYCGWGVPKRFLTSQSIVVDVGLGEDISFSQELIARYGCQVHGFDPTPRAIRYVESLDQQNFILHKFGLAAHAGCAEFFLPNDDAHVSGTLMKSAHTGRATIPVELIDLESLLELVGASELCVLKLDIEGAEYDLIKSVAFSNVADRIRVLCIEFHHRWSEIGPQATVDAVRSLRELGFECVWRNIRTNEEFAFVR